MSWIDNVDAVLFVGYAGEQTGVAVEKVLTGKVNPSAKLTSTWPIDYSSAPDAMYFPGTTKNVYYYDDIYVGYRYYSTFNVEVAYPFGYGLLYTEFTYSDFDIQLKEDGNVKAYVTVKNTGSVYGREVVQLYISKLETTMEKAAFELAGFGKTSSLDPGSSETLEIIIPVEALMSYDTENSVWICDSGTYTISVGKSIAYICANKTFKLDEKVLVKDVENRYEPTVEFEYIKKDTYEVPSKATKTNLALGKEAWTNHSEDSNSTDVSYEASKAVDGDFITRWSGFGLSEGNHIWQVNLGETFEIGEINIRWESISIPFNVYVSEDGENFTDAGLFFDDGSLNTKLNLHGMKARFIRLEITKGGFVSIFEFMTFEATEEDKESGDEVIEKPNIALGRPVTSTQCEGTYIKENAVDGSKSTRWGSLPNGEAWIQVDLESVKNVTSIQAYPEAAWVPYRVEYSTDGEIYTKLKSFNKDELMVKLENLDIEARYIRFYREGENWFSIYEIEVFGE